MKWWTRQRWHFCILVAAVVMLAVPEAFAADSGPLDIGTRLLELQQPVVQVSDYNKISVHAYAVDDGMDFVGSDPDPLMTGRIGSDSQFIGAHACAAGGCLELDEDGNLVDNRFLFSTGTCDEGLRFVRVTSDTSSPYVDSHGELHNPVGVPNTDGSPFMDVAATDWNGDGYPDFAILYLGKHDGSYAFYLTLVDGKPDEQGKFTCYQEDSWRWTLQSKHDGGMTQGRIAAGDVDGDGTDELVLHLGNQKLDGDNYQNLLGVYEISSGFSLGSGVTRSAGETKEYWDALDVAVGDFRGTGKMEIAAISSNQCDVWLKVWELTGSSLSKTADLGDVGTLPKNKGVAGYLRCVAGDLNGDGRDEIVWAGGDRHTDSGKVVLVVHTNLDEEGGLSFYKCPAQYPLESNAGHPVFDLALGYFTEGNISSNTDYFSKMQIALAVRVGNDTVSRRVLSWNGQTFSQGDVSSIGDIDFSDNDYLTLTAADMLQQTLSLGDPEHSKVLAQLSPMVVMQAGAAPSLGPHRQRGRGCLQRLLGLQDVLQPSEQYHVDDPDVVSVFRVLHLQAEHYRRLQVLRPGGHEAECGLFPHEQKGERRSGEKRPDGDDEAHR